MDAHPLLHAAEGELFRRAIAAGCAACKVPVIRVAVKELYIRGAKSLHIEEDGLREQPAAVGRIAGRPWGQDQKDALLAALIALRARRQGQ